MKAVVYERYGGPENLELKEVPQPVPRDREVLVRVRAVSLNDWDWAYLTGVPRLYRLMSGLAKPRYRILGSDVAGTVEAVGPRAGRFRVGDAVFGDLSGRWGGFAEYVCADESALISKPAGMPWTDAAAIPQAAALARQGLVDRGGMRPGMKLLINGAGGGVGIFGVQLAKQNGIEVTGVDNTGKLAAMKALGFDHVIDYTRENFTRNQKKYDLILDQKLSRPLAHYLRALAPGGRYVATGGSLLRIVQLVLLGPILGAFTGKSLRMVALKLNKDLDKWIALYEAGNLKSGVGRVFGLEEVPEAFRLFGSGAHQGKLVVSLDTETAA